MGYLDDFMDPVARVIGPLRPLNRLGAPGAWWHAGRYRGHEVQVGIVTSRGRHALRFRVPLGRPILLWVGPRNTLVRSAPQVSTGDPAFDVRHSVFAWPTEVVARAFDASTRAAVDALCGSSVAGIGTHGGFLELAPRAHQERKGGPTELSLATSLDEAMQLAGQLAAAFDAEADALRRTRGAAAADAWLAAAADHAARQRASLATARGRGRVLVLGCALVVLVGAGLFVARLLSYLGVLR